MSFPARKAADLASGWPRGSESAPISLAGLFVEEVDQKLVAGEAKVHRSPSENDRGCQPTDASGGGRKELNGGFGSVFFSPPADSVPYLVCRVIFLAIWSDRGWAGATSRS